MTAPSFIISKVADPIFAVAIGLSAAVTRIKREETAKGKTGDQIIEDGLRRIGLSKKPSPTPGTSA